MVSVAGNDTHLIAALWTVMVARHWLIRAATFHASEKGEFCFLFILSLFLFIYLFSVLTVYY